MMAKGLMTKFLVPGLIGMLLGMAACGIDNESGVADENSDSADYDGETTTITQEVGGDWLHLPGGQGYATWTWSSNRASLDNIHKVAWDTDCDGEGIYTFLGITNELNYYFEGASVSDACSGGASSVGPTSYRDVANIKRVRVIVCEDVWGSDECTVRDYYPPR